MQLNEKKSRLTGMNGNVFKSKLQVKLGLKNTWLEFQILEISVRKRKFKLF